MHVQFTSIPNGVLVASSFEFFSDEVIRLSRYFKQDVRVSGSDSRTPWWSVLTLTQMVSDGIMIFPVVHAAACDSRSRTCVENTCTSCSWSSFSNSARISLDI